MLKAVGRVTRPGTKLDGDSVFAFSFHETLGNQDGTPQRTFTRKSDRPSSPQGRQANNHSYRPVAALSSPPSFPKGASHATNACGAPKKA